jgi:drug/metabolite transporter (DMT)-like permease
MFTTMSALIATKFGRLQLAVTAVLLPLIALRLFVVRETNDTPLGLSILVNLTWPLLVAQITLGLAARERLMRRDWFAVAAAMVGTLALGASWVVDNQAFGTVDFLLDVTEVFFAVTIGALIWSWDGRRRRLL